MWYIGNGSDESENKTTDRTLQRIFKSSPLQLLPLRTLQLPIFAYTFRSFDRLCSLRSFDKAKHVLII